MAARFEFFPTVEIQVEVYRVVTPCSHVVGEPCCLEMEAARFSKTLASH